MTLDPATILGFVGGAIMVIAFAYSNLARVMDLVLFNLLNLVGAVMLAGSLIVHFNMPALVLEIVWAAIALFGLAKALVMRAQA